MNRSRVTGDLTASGLLYADIANDRVGIGSTIPGNKLSLPDSAKIGLGNAEDLTLFHDGTHSKLKNSTGFLVLESDSFALNNGAGSENIIKGFNGGAVELYHNNVKILNTSSSGVYAYGTNHHFYGTSGGNSNCYLELRSSGTAVYQGLILKNSDGSSNVSVTSHGGSTMYYSATQHVWSVQGQSPSERLELNSSGFSPRSDGLQALGTTSKRWSNVHADAATINGTISGTTGSITGTLTASVLTTSSTVTFSSTSDNVNFTGSSSHAVWLPASNSFRFNDNTKALFGTGEDLRLFHDGSNSYIQDAGTGDLIIKGSNNLDIKSAGDELKARFITNGSCELYHNNILSLRTEANGIFVPGPEGGNSIIYMYADEGDDLADKWTLEATTSSTFTLNYLNDSSSWEKSIECNRDGNVELYHNNSIKLETTSAGVSVTGDLWLSSGNINLADSTGGSNNRIKLGTGDDLQVYHDGSNGYVYNSGSGNLTLVGNGNNRVQIRAKNGENSITCNSDGNVELYHDNSIKLETTSSGVSVTGGITATGDVLFDNGTNANKDILFDASANKLEFSDGVELSLGNGSDLRLYHDGTNNQVRSATGSFILMSDTFDLRSYSSNENMIKGVLNGAVELYHNGTWRVKTNSSGAEVNGEFICGGVNASGEFNMTGNGEKYLDFFTLANNNTVTFRHHNPSGNGFETFATFTANNEATLSFDGVTKFRTTSTGFELPNGVGNNKFLIYNSDILQVGHSGSGLQLSYTSVNSIIDHVSGSGSLYIRGDALRLQTSQSTPEDYIVCSEGGYVQLYHNNSVKLTTASFGVQIEATPRVDLISQGNAVELKFIGNASSHRGSVYADNGNTIGFLKAGTGSWAARWHNDGKQTAHGHIYPNATNSYSLGSGSYRWNEAFIKKLSLNTSSTNSTLTINSGSSANAVTIRNTTLGNGHVGILFSTQDHSGGREKAAIYHVETHGGAHYGGDIAFCLNTATGSAGQVGLSDRKATITRHGGMCFGTDTADANCLDDYEQGTFTPEYGWSGAQQSGFSTSSNHGFYTRVGRLVHIAIWTNFSATPNNGNVLISKLPFTSNSAGGYRGGIPFSWSNITYSSHSSTTQGGRTHINTNTLWMEMGFRSDMNGGGWSSGAITPGGMNNSASFQMEGVYMTT